jgi:lysophospholipase L1-like esterase
MLKLILKRFYVNVIKASPADKNANRKLFGTTLVSFFIIAEILFSFIPQSQGNGQVDLGQRLWQAYYGKPINELGYRDNLIESRLNTNKKKVFFLGDSFTYGSGIENSNNRFSNIVAGKIHEHYEVFNFGKCQSDTRDELNRLKTSNIQPDLLVLQYFHNDIIPTGMRYGYFDYREDRKKVKTKLYYAMLTPIKASFFLNFLFVNVGSKLVNSFYTSWYKHDIIDSFNNKDCIKDHVADMIELINFCKEKNIKLYVLFIPDLTDIDFTQKVYEKHIIPVLKDRDIGFVSIATDIHNISTENLIVNSVDMHANEFVQTIIAAKLIETIPEFK